MKIALRGSLSRRLPTALLALAVVTAGCTDATSPAVKPDTDHARLAAPGSALSDVVSSAALSASSTGSTSTTKAGLANYAVTVTGSENPTPLDVVVVIDE